MNKILNEKQYLAIKISNKEAIYRATKSLAEGKEECSFKAINNNTENPQSPELKGYGVAIWVNEEKEPEQKKQVPQESY